MGGVEFSGSRITCDFWGGASEGGCGRGLGAVAGALGFGGAELCWRVGVLACAGVCGQRPSIGVVAQKCRT